MKYRKDIAAVICFAALIVVFVLLLSSVGKDTSKNERELVARAIRNAVITCYAVEGEYPEDLDYLREHYGLNYDNEMYIVRYDCFASNLFPDITVMERQAVYR